MAKSASEARGKAWASGVRPQTTLTLQETRGAGGLGVHLIARGLLDAKTPNVVESWEHVNEHARHVSNTKACKRTSNAFVPTPGLMSNTTAFKSTRPRCDPGGSRGSISVALMVCTACTPEYFKS